MRKGILRETGYCKVDHKMEEQGGKTMSKQKGNLFREKTMERIQSPEQMDKYLQVTRPKVWVSLIAMLLLFIGLIEWVMIGNLDTLVAADIQVKDKRAVITEKVQSAFYKGTDMSKVGEGTIIYLDGKSYEADGCTVDEDGVTILYAEMDLPDGTYEGQILVESVKAITVLFGND